MSLCPCVHAATARPYPHPHSGFFPACLFFSSQRWQNCSPSMLWSRRRLPSANPFLFSSSTVCLCLQDSARTSQMPKRRSSMFPNLASLKKAPNCSGRIQPRDALSPRGKDSCSDIFLDTTGTGTSTCSSFASKKRTKMLPWQFSSDRHPTIRIDLKS